MIIPQPLQNRKGCPPAPFVDRSGGAGYNFFSFHPGGMALNEGRPTNEYRPFTAAQRRYLPWKRAGDVALSALALALLAVPMGLIALAVKLSAPDQPVLFRQTRVGRDERPFVLWKFRSMDAAEGHITPLGRVLRTASLDELPQLFQVLAGSMSLVGPRPLIPEEEHIRALRRAAGVYRLRPGLTGLAQVNGRDKLDDERKAAFDRQYAESLSPALDMRILLATVGKVLRRADIEEK